MKARFDATGDVVVVAGGANGIGAGLAAGVPRARVRCTAGICTRTRTWCSRCRDLPAGWHGGTAATHANLEEYTGGSVSPVHQLKSVPASRFTLTNAADRERTWFVVSLHHQSATKE